MTYKKKKILISKNDPDSIRKYRALRNQINREAKRTKEQ